jgi:hypothetical protein
MMEEPGTSSPPNAVIVAGGSSGRTILSLMAVTVAFSLVGDAVSSTVKLGQSGYGALLVPAEATDRSFTIILGGTLAAGVLTLIAHAGEAGQKIAVGLALVAAITATLVNGKPVWDAANNAFGSKPTTPLAQTTPSTSPTAPAAAFI